MGPNGEFGVQNGGDTDIMQDFCNSGLSSVYMVSLLTATSSMERRVHTRKIFVYHLSISGQFKKKMV